MDYEDDYGCLFAQLNEVKTMEILKHTDIVNFIWVLGVISNETLLLSFYVLTRL